MLYLEGVANSLLLLYCIVPFLKKTTRTSEWLVEVAQEYRKLSRTEETALKTLTDLDLRS